MKTAKNIKIPCFRVSAKIGTHSLSALMVRVEPTEIKEGSWIAGMKEIEYNKLHKKWRDSEDCNCWKKYLVDRISENVLFLSL